MLTIACSPLRAGYGSRPTLRCKRGQESSLSPFWPRAVAAAPARTATTRDCASASERRPLFPAALQLTGVLQNRLILLKSCNIFPYRNNYNCGGWLWRPYRRRFRRFANFEHGREPPVLNKFSTGPGHYENSRFDARHPGHWGDLRRCVTATSARLLHLLPGNVEGSAAKRAYINRDLNSRGDPALEEAAA